MNVESTVWQIFFDKVLSYGWDIYIPVFQIVVMFIISEIIVLKLLDSRYDNKTTNAVIAISCSFMGLLNIVMMILCVGMFEIFAQLTIVSFALLTTVSAVIISKWDFGKTMFGTLVGISIIAMIMETSMVFMEFFEGNIAISTAMFVPFCIFAGGFTWFLQKVFKPQFVYTFRELPEGWGWYSFIPISYIVVHCMYYLSTMDRDWRIYLNMGVIGVMLILSYGLLFFHISSIRRRERARMNAKIYETQVEMLSGQINASQEAENNLKIMRHDLKHYIATLKEYFDHGEVEKAKEYIGYVNQNVESFAREYYCENSIINACVGYYIKMAREADIKISYKLQIPNEATESDIEFSTVIANALENSIHACREVAVDNRKIDFIAHVQDGKILFEICNSFRGKIYFDENQIPITKEGIGITSIIAYAKANKANVQFFEKDGIFTFRMVVNIRA